MQRSVCVSRQRDAQVLLLVMPVEESKTVRHPYIVAKCAKPIIHDHRKETRILKADHFSDEGTALYIVPCHAPEYGAVIDGFRYCCGGYLL